MQHMLRNSIEAALPRQRALKYKSNPFSLSLLSVAVCSGSPLFFMLFMLRGQHLKRRLHCVAPLSWGKGNKTVSYFKIAPAKETLALLLLSASCR